MEESMRKPVKYKFLDKFIELGIAIAATRKLRGMSQEQLAEHAGISRVQLALIESPNSPYSFSLETLFSIADALNVSPVDLLSAKIPS